MIPVAAPELDGNELRYLRECVESGWISSLGRFVRDFETALAAQVGVRHALATSSGTTALHLALAALDVGPGDEVIVPDFTFAATINAVLYCGATPVIVDVERETWGLDPQAVRRAVTERTKAIVLVHLYGHPCDVDPLRELARERDIRLVEDAAEAQGATYRGAPIGALSDIACFSFYANKLISTGEGGACLTDDARLHTRMAELRDHHMSPQKRYWHLGVGFNYRMTNLQAAVGVAQLERLERFVGAKRRIAAAYRQRLRRADVAFPPQAEWAESAHWMINVLLGDGFPASRERLMQGMLERGVETRPLFYPLHQMPPYRPFVRPGQSFPVTEDLSARGLSLPSGTALTEAQIDRVCEAFEAAACDHGQ